MGRIRTHGNLSDEDSYEVLSARPNRRSGSILLLLIRVLKQASAERLRRKLTYHHHVSDSQDGRDHDEETTREEQDQGDLTTERCFGGDFPWSASNRFKSNMPSTIRDSGQVMFT